MADSDQLRALIDESLTAGLAEELEDQMLSGGGGANFTGLATTPNVQTQSFVENNLVTAMKARTKIRTVGHARPTAYLLNPADVENIALWRDNNNNFQMLQPNGPFTNFTLWGLPVVQNEGVPAGTGYCGDFRELYLFDRQASTLYVTDSHSDLFLRNILVVLAELRAGFA